MAGRLVSVGNGVSSFGYTLDAVGNRIAMTQALGGKAHAITYGYDDLWCPENRCVSPMALENCAV